MKKHEKIIAIVVLLLIVIIYSCLTHLFWRKGPRAEYYAIVNRFGKPHFVNFMPNGVAVWKRFEEKCPFVRIMIVDENVPHDTPSQHCDFIYTTIKYHIDPKKLMDVLAISDSIMYDKLKEELTIRCESLEASMATFVLADKVHEDIVVADDITYKKYITDAKKDSVSNYIILQNIREKYEIKHADYGSQ